MPPRINRIIIACLVLLLLTTFSSCDKENEKEFLQNIENSNQSDLKKSIDQNSDDIMNEGFISLEDGVIDYVNAFESFKSRKEISLFEVVRPEWHDLEMSSTSSTDYFNTEAVIFDVIDSPLEYTNWFRNKVIVKKGRDGFEVSTLLYVADEDYYQGNSFAPSYDNFYGSVFDISFENEEIIHYLIKEGVIEKVEYVDEGDVNHRDDVEDEDDDDDEDSDGCGSETWWKDFTRWWNKFTLKLDARVQANRGGFTGDPITWHRGGVEWNSGEGIIFGGGGGETSRYYNGSELYNMQSKMLRMMMISSTTNFVNKYKIDMTALEFINFLGIDCFEEKYTDGVLDELILDESCVCDAIVDYKINEQYENTEFICTDKTKEELLNEAKNATCPLVTGKDPMEAFDDALEGVDKIILTESFINNVKISCIWKKLIETDNEALCKIITNFIGETNFNLTLSVKILPIDNANTKLIWAKKI